MEQPALRRHWTCTRWPHSSIFSLIAAALALALSSTIKPSLFLAPQAVVAAKFDTLPDEERKG